MSRKQKSTDEDDDDNFDADQVKIHDALELAARVASYTGPPVKGTMLGESELREFNRNLIAYEAKRALDIGLDFLPSCTKCKEKKSCKIDISGLEGKRRVFKCSACIVGKTTCTNAQEAKSAYESWQKYLAMGQDRGKPGQEWRLRVNARHLAKQIRKQARLEKKSRKKRVRDDVERRPPHKAIVIDLTRACD